VESGACIVSCRHGQHETLTTSLGVYKQSILPTEGRAIAGSRHGPMRSTVNWALLGLVIERPSYAYELAQRFERTYRGALSLSSTSHVYTALTTLSERALVEELDGGREGRQPKPRYRATARGLESYADWLIEQVEEERRRQRLMVLALGTLKARPEALAVLDRYERAVSNASVRDIETGGGDGGCDCIARLLLEERRLSTEARLSWVALARERLESCG
jgi:DNA-binding PadR family transcriptional regulator